MKPNGERPGERCAMKYHIWTMGCQMNDADSRHLASRLEQAGFAACRSADDADLVILNTCVVRQQAEDKAWARLHYVQQLKRRRPQLRVALMGCMVGARGRGADAVRKDLDFVDFFLPPSDPGPLLEALAATAPAPPDAAALDRADDERERRVRDAIQNRTEYSLPDLEKDAVVAYVPVVLGCSHACTYCIIPYRRGGERSRPADDVLREVRQLAAAGIREVLLLGQIVDRYGLDLPGGPDLADLLRQVAAVEGILRVRFLTSHPNHLTDKLIAAVAEVPGVCPHFELPVQSGDDGVLERMRRGYTIGAYRRIVERIRARLPQATIHTDVIVGFPGESESAYANTRRLIEEVRFDKVHLARYSVRPQTYAARRFEDDIPPEEKERRCTELDLLQRRIQAEKNAPLKGATVDVLVESRDEKRGRWRGRTPDERLVFFDGPPDLRGRLAKVRIAWAGPYSLIGEAAGGSPAQNDVRPGGE